MLSITFHIAVSVFGFLLASSALAREQSRWMESSRFLGRGGTFVAAFDSDEATRGNPATLAEGDITFQLRWAQMDLFIGQNTIDTISDLTTLSANDSAVTLLNNFKDKFGKRQYGRFQASPLAMRIFYFEAMPFMSTNNYVDARGTLPEVEFLSDSLFGMNFGLGIPWGKELLIGTNLRPAYRTYFSADMSFADVLTFVDDDNFQLDDVFEQRNSMHMMVDLGAIYKAGKAWRFGLLVENIGYGGTLGEFKDPAPAIQQRVNLGMTYRYDMKSWQWDSHADIQDLINPENHNYLRLIHLGTELGTSYFSRDLDLGVMTGLNEGYFTFGGYVDAWIVRFTATNYAVELGEYPGQRPDRRWGFSLASTMTF